MEESKGAQENKVCPILSIANAAKKAGQPESAILHCMKEKCALWAEKAKDCGLKSQE